ncbi:MAG: putative bifunctional diguanylate cyclase/phosphodiesterase [Methylobacter sp.]
MINTMQEPRPLILTIDDDDMVRLMLEDILSREGFEVLGAADGQAGLEMFREHHPDLVLLDIMMPKMDGFICLETLRALSSSRLLPIVMLTGADDVESIHNSFGLGATDFITKPICWATLPYRLRYMMCASEALGNLAHSEATLYHAQKIARLGNWNWDVNNDLMTCSKEALNVLGVAPESFHSHPFALFKAIHPSDVQSLRQALDRCTQQGRAFSLEARLVHADETVHIVHIQGEAEMQQGRVDKLHGTVQDITERRKIEDQVHHLSYFDPLTNLPNRTLFKEILRQAIKYCDRHEVFLVGLFVSIDSFKRINETLGPTIGDRLLQMFTERLIGTLRDSDYMAVARDLELDFEIGGIDMDITVSRLGDSEFSILLNYIQDTRDSAKVANRIFKEMAAPFEVDGNEIYLAVNIGIAVYPEDGKEVDAFIKNGEFAMNHAHEQGPNSHQFFSKSLNVAAFRKLSMESSLHHAIERNELVLHYQPKIDLRCNQVVGMEALVRWQHPTFGLVPPAQFIPIAETSGLIVPIGHWILVTACRQLRAWQLEGMPSLMISVNISSFQLRQKEFVRHVRDILNSTGLAADNLKLELTESALMVDISDAMNILQEIRALGVRISINDFGTGYSSLSYLKKLPISELKIDQALVKDIPHSEDDKAVTSAIIALAKSLSLEVAAEGVENEQQVAFLCRNACETAQGYFYSRPLPSNELGQFIHNYK